MPLDGFTKAWRKELESEVWLMPPLYVKVWYYLRHIVQWEPYLFPTLGKFGIWVLPGQRILSIRQIAEGVKWIEWGKEVIPNTKTISAILKWFEDRGMITVKSNAKGTLITIINWDIYQSKENEKVTRDGQQFLHALDTSEERIEGKEVKSLKDNKRKSFAKPSVAEVQTYMKEIEFNGDAQKFIDHYDIVGWVYGKSKIPIKDWKAAVRTWQSNGKKYQTDLFDGKPEYMRGVR